MFYDGPEPPPGIFDDILLIPEIPITTDKASFLKLFNIFPSSDPLAGRRSVLLTRLIPTPAGQKADHYLERILALCLSCSIRPRSSKR
jgi:hypothetical protein